MHFFSDQYLSGTQNYFKHVQSQGYNEVNDSRTIEKCGKKITEVVDEFLEENEEEASNDDDDAAGGSGVLVVVVKEFVNKVFTEI